MSERPEWITETIEWMNDSTEGSELTVRELDDGRVVVMEEDE